eukprot:TRINITY_DN1890_c0_g1_i1.p1 TRINITY_DN1890_c0_g1~~TRINITY_DN1890_c0_g1_i1.p1  ORF type:complete len:644 (-),score=280.47 TRINITY_DN1890_c0_g1_i1:113-2044(-)
MSNFILYYKVLNGINTNTPKSSSQKKNNNNNNNQQKKNNKNKSKGRKKNVSVKPPKGTRDFKPEQMAIRERIINTITKIFKKFGGVTIETPVFELTNILTEKYGEDEKLIFNLEDQGGQICSLRYDLTVPFARFMGSNSSIQQIKRYQIGRVYRRDQPRPESGRYREFYQCDFDIAGEYGVMLPDAELLKICSEILTTLDVGDFKIKVNHRSLLDGIFEVSGVPADKFREICSSVDKLDKLSWEEVKKEMVEAKQLDEEVADNIKEFVLLNGKPFELVGVLKSKDDFMKNERVQKGIKEMELLFDYANCFGIVDNLSFDLSLARGLDYYTGLIFEAVLMSNKINLGSIAGGGRYDNLIGMFSKKSIPSVGFSVGIERIFVILEKRELAKKEADRIRAKETDVFVISMEKKDNFLQERLKIVNELWAANINAETLLKPKPKPNVQLNYANQNNIPFAVIIGGKELENKEITIKKLYLPQDASEKQVTIPRSDLVKYLCKELSIESSVPDEKNEEDDSDFDLFGDDDEDEFDAIYEKELEERAKAHLAKKAAKGKKVIDKSAVVFDVKPESTDVDLNELEKNVRAIQMDGLMWGEARFEEIAYSIKKIVISCVIVDELVSTDDIEELIYELEISSVDVVSFSKCS